LPLRRRGVSAERRPPTRYQGCASPPGRSGPTRAAPGATSPSPALRFRVRSLFPCDRADVLKQKQEFVRCRIQTELCMLERQPELVDRESACGMPVRVGDLPMGGRRERRGHSVRQPMRGTRRDELGAVGRSEIVLGGHVWTAFSIQEMLAYASAIKRRSPITEQDSRLGSSS
jgi:hypothetical protein